MDIPIKATPVSSSAVPDGRYKCRHLFFGSMGEARSVSPIESGTTRQPPTGQLHWDSRVDSHFIVARRTVKKCGHISTVQFLRRKICRRSLESCSKTPSGSAVERPHRAILLLLCRRRHI
uniref:Uncharacterized protein n=1 Tax=Trichuris muris TaxID=70415 RepID=A0A5S6R036_TRIMR